MTSKDGKRIQPKKHDSEHMLQPECKRYLIALNKKQRGKLPLYEEELWRHCCYQYHRDVSHCDLCRPRNTEERLATKQKILDLEKIKKLKLELKLKLKRKRIKERVAAYRKSLTPEKKAEIREKNRIMKALKRMNYKVKQIDVPQTRIPIKQEKAEDSDITPEDAKRKRIRENVTTYRKSLTSEKKAEIREKDRIRRALKRMKNKQEKIDQIIALNMIVENNKRNNARIRKQISRSNMTAENKAEIREKDRIRRARNRMKNKQNGLVGHRTRTPIKQKKSKDNDIISKDPVSPPFS